MKKLIFFMFSLLFLNCGYHKDKLRIKNNSNSNVCYVTILNADSVYYQPSAGGCLNSGSFDYPTVKGSISYEIEQNSIDKILYIVYCQNKDLEYIYKNIKNIVNNKKFRVDKYSLKELDSLNWKIEYNE